MHLEVSATKDDQVVAVAFLTDPSDEEIMAAIGKLMVELKLWGIEPLWPIQLDIRAVQNPSIKIPAA
jgi:hypothetical protein